MPPPPPSSSWQRLLLLPEERQAADRGVCAPSCLRRRTGRPPLCVPEEARKAHACLPGGEGAASCLEEPGGGASAPGGGAIYASEAQQHKVAHGATREATGSSEKLRIKGSSNRIL